MPKATRIAAPIAASSATRKSDGHPLVYIVLFSALGLLASLVAILMGVQDAWF